MAALDELIAQAEIQLCALGRLHCLDEKDWGRYGDFHTADVVSRTWGDLPGGVAATGQPVVVRRDALVAAVQAALGGPVQITTVHRAQLASIAVSSPDTARAVWAMEDRLWWTSEHGEESLHGWGHYHEEYRLDGRWRISSRELRRTRVEHTDHYFEYLAQRH